MAGGVELDGFVKAATIEPDRDRWGRVVEEMPQSRYRGVHTKSLHRFGAGPFCHFTVRGLPPQEGVYCVVIDNEVVYVGRSDDLERIWGSTGIATISPSACYVGGQSTNCKVNHGILRAAQANRLIELWIKETTDSRRLKAALVHRLTPRWNDNVPSPHRGTRSRETHR